jgi:membrane protein YdbS with pleckstrin-like domain
MLGSLSRKISAAASQYVGDLHPVSFLVDAIHQGAHMSYVEANLVPGERVIYKTKLHWSVMLWNIIFGCLLLALGGFLLYYARTHVGIEVNSVYITEIAAIVLIVGGFVLILVGNLRRSATEMAVTNRRVIIKRGLASRTTIEMLLSKVESVEVSEPAFGRMMGYGSIVVIGTGGTSEPFHKMAHPLEFRSQVQQQIEKLRPGDDVPGGARQGS